MVNPASGHSHGSLATGLHLDAMLGLSDPLALLRQSLGLLFANDVSEPAPDFPSVSTSLIRFCCVSATRAG